MSELLADSAYHELRDQLVTLRIPPGAPLRDADIADEIGIGRTPVREALKRLETDRLVVTYPRRGTFATSVDITDLSHLNEVRRDLEPLAARAAASRATDEQRSILEEHLQNLLVNATGMSPSELMDADMSLHRSLYEATNNPYLRDTLTYYDNLATRIWCLFLPRLPRMDFHVLEHGPLLEAVIRGDEDAAADAASEHLEHFEESIRLVL